MCEVVHNVILAHSKREERGAMDSADVDGSDAKIWETVSTDLLVFVLNSDRQTAVQPPPPLPFPAPPPQRQPQHSPLQPLWRPLQPRPSSSCPSSFHPVFSPTIHSSLNATFVLAHVMFLPYFYFFCTLGTVFPVCKVIFMAALFSLLVTTCLTSLLLFSFQMHLTLFLSAIYSFLPSFFVGRSLSLLSLLFRSLDLAPAHRQLTWTRPPWPLTLTPSTWMPRSPLSSRASPARPRACRAASRPRRPTPTACPSLRR